MIFDPDVDAAGRVLQKAPAALPPGVSPEQAGYLAMGACYSQTLWIGRSR